LLVPEVGDVSVVAEERHEVTEATEIVLHQVKIEIPADRLPPEQDALRQKLITLAEIWARACIADRNAELSEL
jgi:hypothetical protein